MSIESVQNLSASTAVGPAALAGRLRLTENGPVAITLNPIDTVELSAEAIEAEEQTHSAKVLRVREALAEGTYLDPDKWDAALDRLLRDIEKA